MIHCTVKHNFYPRPQDLENTASRPICAVNQGAAQLVPRWGTTRESQVLWFLYFLTGLINGPHLQDICNMHAGHVYVFLAIQITAVNDKQGHLQGQKQGQMEIGVIDQGLRVRDQRSVIRTPGSVLFWYNTTNVKIQWWRGQGFGPGLIGSNIESVIRDYQPLPIVTTLSGSPVLHVCQ